MTITIQSQLTLEEFLKAPIYARATIADYWILDIIERCGYIFRNPTPSGYQVEMILTADDAISPLVFPTIEIPFSQLFLP